MSGLGGIDVGAGAPPEAAAVLSDDALALVARLHRDFEPRRQQLLEARAKRRARIAAGEELDFLERTRAIREGDWTVAPAPAVLRDRRVEITGPTDRKMVINALNSGASGFMADFEDANSPTWANMIGGQRNLIDAVAGTISLEENERRYTLDATPATLLVRPRGWHLVERGLRVGGDPVAGASMPASSSFTTPARCWRTEPPLRSTCPSSRAISKRGSGATCSPRSRTRWDWTGEAFASRS